MSADPQSKLQVVKDMVADHMDGILTAFKPGARITVLVRAPAQPDRDFMMTNDTIPELVEMLKRRSDEAPPTATADGAPT